MLSIAGVVIGPASRKKCFEENNRKKCRKKEREKHLFNCVASVIDGYLFSQTVENHAIFFPTIPHLTATVTHYLTIEISYSI